MSVEAQRSTAKEADRFLDLVRRAGLWRSIDLRICAIRSGRRWVNLVTRCVLDHRPARAVARHGPVTRRSFRAWQVVRPIAELPAVVGGIVEGRTKLRPRSVSYGQPDQPGIDLRYGFNENPQSHRRREYDHWSSHALVGYGVSIWDAVRQAGHDPLELDGMIRHGPRAYDGLPDLVRGFCGRPAGLEVQGTSTVVELIAPMAVRFEREKVTRSPEGVTVGLRTAADVFVSEAELAWNVGLAGAPRHHGSIELCEGEWKADGDTLHWQQDIKVREDAATATFFILIGDRCVDTITVPLAGTSPRLRAHRVLDTDFSRFQEDLLPDGSRRAKEFEYAVGLLFFFFGFGVDPLYSQRATMRKLRLTSV